MPLEANRLEGCLDSDPFRIHQTQSCSLQVGPTSVKGPPASQYCHGKARRYFPGVKLSSRAIAAWLPDYPQPPSYSSGCYGWSPVTDSSQASGSTAGLTALCQLQCAPTFEMTACSCSFPEQGYPGIGFQSRLCARWWSGGLFVKRLAAFAFLQPFLHFALGLRTWTDWALLQEASSLAWAPCSSWSWSESRACSRSQSLHCKGTRLSRGPSTHSSASCSFWRYQALACLGMLWEALAGSWDDERPILQRLVCAPCCLACRRCSRHWIRRLSWLGSLH